MDDNHPMDSISHTDAPLASIPRSPSQLENATAAQGSVDSNHLQAPPMIGDRHSSNPSNAALQLSGDSNQSALKKKPPSQWSVSDVKVWLIKIGFNDSIANFMNAGIDGANLLSLNEEDLTQRVKVTSPMLRQHLLEEISVLKRREQSTRATELSPSKRSGGSGTKKRTASESEEGEVEEESWELMLNSVIKIFCTSTTPNYAQPWQMKRQCSSTSSGFVISGNRIIGNAHGVTNSSSIRVRKHGDAKKYPAYVIANAHECDLCMLGVNDPQFWLGLEHMELGGIPRLHESVTVVGYPQGGDNISVTKGVVSRVIVSTYSHSGESLLSIQIDAAINSGNSGGPVVQNNKVCGVAFEAMTQAQNIGYIIPTPVLKHFINDFDRNGCYTGFPRIGFSWQKLENDSLRKYYKVPDDKHGVVISGVEPLDTAAGKLKRDDVLIAVDGVPLGDDGTVFFRRGERVSFRYIETTKYIGDTVTMTVVRDGQEIDLGIRLESRKPLVPLHLHDRLPSYYVTAGLVFTVLSRSYLYHEYGKEWHKKAPVELVELSYYGQMDRADRQVVILSQLLVDDVNNGYGAAFHNLRVLDINGTPIINIAQMVDTLEAIEREQQPFIRVNLDRDKMLVLETSSAIESNERILRQNNISVNKSPDLLGLPPQWTHRPITPRGPPRSFHKFDSATKHTGDSPSGGKKSTDDVIINDHEKPSTIA